jgi:hypothetical protein
MPTEYTAFVITRKGEEVIVSRDNYLPKVEHALRRKALGDDGVSLYKLQRASNFHFLDSNTKTYYGAIRKT